MNRLSGSSLCMFVVFGMLSGCALMRANGLAPASDCASDLVDHGYLQSARNPRRDAESICFNNTPEQIATAKNLVDGRYFDKIHAALQLVQEGSPEQVECARKEYDASPPGQGKTLRISEKCRDLALVPTAPRPPSTSNPGAKDVIATLEASGNFTMFLKGLAAANLIATLKGGGPFTLFAPTDDSFAKMNEGAYEGILARPEQLKQVMLLHVVPGAFLTTSVETHTKLGGKRKGHMKLTTIGTGVIHLEIEGDEIKAGRGKILKADVSASNGVVQIIDDLLRP